MKGWNYVKSEGAEPTAHGIEFIHIIGRQSLHL